MEMHAEDKARQRRRRRRLGSSLRKSFSFGSTNVQKSRDTEEAPENETRKLNSDSGMERMSKLKEQRSFRIDETKERIEHAQRPGWMEIKSMGAPAMDAPSPPPPPPIPLRKGEEEEFESSRPLGLNL